MKRGAPSCWFSYNLFSRGRVLVEKFDSQKLKQNFKKHHWEILNFHINQIGLVLITFLWLLLLLKVHFNKNKNENKIEKTS